RRAEARLITKQWDTPVMEAPETRYTLSGDVNIAYQVVGGAARPRLYPQHDPSRRAPLGEPSAVSVLQSARFARPPAPVRQARYRHVRPRCRGADARGAHGRHPRGHGRRRGGACSRWWARRGWSTLRAVRSRVSRAI